MAAWSPWEDIDPDMQRTYAGAESGVGANYAWSGNRKAGAGPMEITDVATPTGWVSAVVPQAVQGREPDRLHARAAGDRTRVTWRLNGDANGVTKVLGAVRACSTAGRPGLREGPRPAACRGQLTPTSG